MGNVPTGLRDGDAFPRRRLGFISDPRFFELRLALSGRPRAALVRIAGPSNALFANRDVQIRTVDLPINCSYN